MPRYSRVIKSASGRRYRYNYDTALLEWIVKENGQEDVMSSIGLGRENFESDRRGWVEMWDDELSEELAYLEADFEAEMKRTQNRI